MEYKEKELTADVLNSPIDQKVIEQEDLIGDGSAEPITSVQVIFGVLQRKAV